MDKQAEHVRDRLIVRTSLVAIGTNLCLVAFKMAVGLLANSIAIVLDAMNNLSDACPPSSPFWAPSWRAGRRTKSTPSAMAGWSISPGFSSRGSFCLPG